MVVGGALQTPPEEVRGQRSEVRGQAERAHLPWPGTVGLTVERESPSRWNTTAPPSRTRSCRTSGPHMWNLGPRDDHNHRVVRLRPAEGGERGAGRQKPVAIVVIVLTPGTHALLKGTATEESDVIGWNVCDLTVTPVTSSDPADLPETLVTFDLNAVPVDDQSSRCGLLKPRPQLLFRFLRIDRLIEPKANALKSGERESLSSSENAAPSVMDMRPLSTTGATPPHTHTHTHTRLLISNNSRPITSLQLTRRLLAEPGNAEQAHAAEEEEGGQDEEQQLHRGQGSPHGDPGTSTRVRKYIST
ncbi:hypothetical protein EYF80_032936 [Liparis tanakae]|uniref:Uncharacterized protein n=1 Tax=Liparis tanakae TaxID=230148 RepID=A0A4Z2GUD9_9TELE|nr:hypothetical protein EYF80_032936 [Liparis tanakae]